MTASPCNKKAKVWGAGMPSNWPQHRHTCMDKKYQYWTMQATNKTQPNSFSDLMKASSFVTDYTGQKWNMGNMALSLLQRKGQTCGKREQFLGSCCEKLQKKGEVLGQAPSETKLDVLGTPTGSSQIRYGLYLEWTLNRVFFQIAFKK